MSTEAERIASLENEMGHRAENDKILFGLVNKDITPAFSEIRGELRVLSEQNQNTLSAQKEMLTDIREVREQHLQCQAAREEQSKQSGKAVAWATKAGSYAAVGAFGTGLVAGLYKILVVLLQHADK